IKKCNLIDNFNGAVVKKYLLKGILLSSCIALLIWSVSEEDIVNKQADKEQKNPTVSVLAVLPSDSSLTVKVSGLTIARWPLAVKSAVGGRVVALNGNTNPGDSINKLQMLVQISSQPYRVSVSRAQAKVSRAEFELTNYKHKQYVAKKISGETKLSPFGSFDAHILTAKSELNYAKSELEYALQMLKEANIKSPYPAVVVKKMVTPSQWVEVGEPLFEIISSESIDVKVELSDINWQRLKSRISVGGVAKVAAPSGKEWLAHVRYLAPILDDITRQRSLVLNINKPFSGEDPLLPDQFVNVIFEGENIENIVNAPSSALTQDGKVWTLLDGQLFLEEIELIEQSSDVIKFRYINKPEINRLLVRFPLNSMLQGQQASPKLLANEAGEYK
ncbi:efflux RND transporter periplasmic adaptor subunit, partial [Psychromonas antarctica]|uniref:efflux RND transporter periplasmic adaptor subunit n=1 Tax=Psychromonas antarctica TaxID=67573 RepID=UPI001EE7EFA8